MSLPEVWFLDPDSCPVLSRDEQVTRGEEGEEGGSKNWTGIWVKNAKSHISTKEQLYGKD